MATISDKEGGGYRLFGQLFLPEPHKYLSPSELKKLENFEPFIRDLEDRQKGRRLLAVNFLIINNDCENQSMARYSKK